MWENKKPKSKYALILVADVAYLSGANSIINALDYYGNEVDLHFIHKAMPEHYLEDLKKADLNYRLVLINYDDLLKEWRSQYPASKEDLYHDSCYIRHWYRTKLKDQYSVIGLAESDNILLSNITPWFELVEGTDKLVTAHHIYQSFPLENYGEAELEFLQPLYIQPTICDPNKWDDAFQIIVEKEKERKCDMMIFNQSVFLANKKDKVVILPDAQWIGGWIWTAPIVRENLKDGRSYLKTSPSHMRISMIHGKWYSAGFRQNQLQSQQEEHRDVMKRNLDLILEMYRLLNLNHKVNLEALFDDHKL